MRLLLVEDDDDLGEAVHRQLKQSGIAVDWAKDGEEAHMILGYQAYDLICLDLGLPSMSGFEILRALRNRGDLTPVLVLTARSAVEDRVEALDIGADDYLAKPYDLREFEARCRALMRRVQGIASGSTTVGTLTLDRASRSVLVGDRPLRMPNREYRLLEIFVGNIGRALSKEQISAKMFSFDDEVGANAIELYVGRLRRKLDGALSIRTMYGYGYIAEVAVTEDE